MKKGCLIFLLVFAVFSYLDWILISQYHPDWSGFVALGGGLLVGIIFANIGGLYTILRQKRALSSEPGNWKEGMFIGLSGRIGALKTPLISPVTGSNAVLYEYDVKRTESSGNHTSKISDYMGFGMAPCGIQTQRGSLRLVGFPMLANFPRGDFNDESHYERLAKYLETAKLTPRSKGVLGALKQINEVLRDEDGDVHLDLSDSAARVDPRDSQEEALDPESQEEARAAPTFGAATDPTNIALSQFVQDFKRSGYSLEEQVVTNGAQVTAFGTYHESPARLDVGGMFDTFSHSIFPGTASEVVSKNLVKTVIDMIVWSAIAGAAHWFAFPEFFHGLVRYFSNLAHST